MEEDIRKRIKMVFDESKTKYSTETVSGSKLQAKFSRQINGVSKRVSYDVIKFVLDRFPEISAEWLVRGEGDMLKPTRVVIAQSPKATTVRTTRARKAIEKKENVKKARVTTTKRLTPAAVKRAKKKSTERNLQKEIDELKMQIEYLGKEFGSMK